MKDYQQHSAATDLPSYEPVLERLSDEQTAKLLHAIIGIVTEAGELADQLKKHLIYGKPLDVVNIFEELGDLHWYEALAYRTIGKDFETAMSANLAKLRARYPEKFNEGAALTRDLDSERRGLERDFGERANHG